MSSIEYLKEFFRVVLLVFAALWASEALITLTDNKILALIPAVLAIGFNRWIFRVLAPATRPETPPARGGDETTRDQLS